MAKAPPSIAATSTLAMVSAAEARGIDTAAILAQMGLSRSSIEDSDARLPGPIVMSIWAALRERTADPLLHLEAPAHLPFGAYRVIDYLVATSATVGEGMQRFARFFGLIADGVNLCIDQENEIHFLELSMADGAPVPPVYVDYVFSALSTRIRMRIRQNLRIHRLELRQSEPENAARYVDHFRAPVHFGAKADRLCFDGEEWDSPMETADPALAQLMEEHARLLAERVAGATTGFQAEVRQAIAAVLPEGGSVDEVANRLHMSVRTLQRRLVETGTTFTEIHDRVRGKLALEYLNDPKVSIAEVAILLGFSAQSSFNRAFRRWTGQAPGRWRRARA